MNRGEALDTNQILAWLLEDDGAPDEAAARTAAARLADRAHRALGAGHTAASVRDTWRLTPDE